MLLNIAEEITVLRVYHHNYFAFHKYFTYASCISPSVIPQGSKICGRGKYCHFRVCVCVCDELFYDSNEILTRLLMA